MTNGENKRFFYKKSEIPRSHLRGGKENVSITNKYLNPGPPSCASKELFISMELYFFLYNFY